MTSTCWFQTELDQSSDEAIDTDNSDRKPKQRYCCAVCGAYVTDDRFMQRINGQHQYTKINPDQHTFVFACFSAARGCQASGPATDKDSWFSGYRWRFAHCNNCATQLGWHFSGEQPFFGLILEQLVDCPKDLDD